MYVIKRQNVWTEKWCYFVIWNSSGRPRVDRVDKCVLHMNTSDNAFEGFVFSYCSTSVKVLYDTVWKWCLVLSMYWRHTKSLFFQRHRNVTERSVFKRFCVSAPLPVNVNKENIVPLIVKLKGPEVRNNPPTFHEK